MSDDDLRTFAREMSGRSTTWGHAVDHLALAFAAARDRSQSYEEMSAFYWEAYEEGCNDARAFAANAASEFGVALPADQIEMLAQKVVAALLVAALDRATSFCVGGRA